MTEVGHPGIERVETYVLRVPLRRPIQDALYRRTHWHIPVVEIATSEGLLGTGYSGVWAGEELMLDAIDHYFAPQLLGRDPRDIRRIWHDLYWSDSHWVGRAGIAHMALGMVDTALWDLASQRSKQPLWRLLGGRHSELDTYNTDGGWLNLSRDDLTRELLETVQAGWRRVKMKVGSPDVRDDLERVEVVRSSLPPDVDLMVDVNQGWDLQTAKWAAPRLADLGVTWLEEPLHPDDVLGHAALARATSIPIALGENVYNLEAFCTFIHLAAVDIVQADVTRLAGVTEWLKVAGLAAANARWLIPHAGDMMQLHQHLVAGVGATKPGLIEYLPWGLEVFKEPVDMQGSTIRLPETPGASTAIAPIAKRKWSSKR